MPVVSTILIVDNDVGFAFWLGQGLHQAGYTAFPAESAPRAKAILDELKIAVDLLIVDSALPGAAGLVESLRYLNPNLKVIVLIDNDPGQDQIPDADAFCLKPFGTDKASRQNLIAQIEKIIPPSRIH